MTQHMRPTLLYLNASSQFMLLSGIIPKRWTINSSGSTVVFISTSTMSMAGLHPFNQTRSESDLASIAQRSSD